MRTTNLGLQGNQLEIVERSMLRRLPSLTHLDLRDKLISHIDAADSFAEVPLLTELLLDGNQLSHTVEDPATPPAPQAPGAPRPGSWSRWWTRW